jgi:hypothetical protein
MGIKKQIYLKRIKKAGGVIPAIQKGIVGYHIWDKIVEQNGKFIVEIDPSDIEKGVLTPNRLYNITFKFAEKECQLLKTT